MWPEIEAFLAPYQGKTQLHYRHWLLDFAAFCRQHSADGVDQLQRDHLEHYRRFLTWTPNSSGRLNKPNTVYSAVRVARSFLLFCGIEIGRFVLPRPLSSKLEPLTAEQLALLLTSRSSSELAHRDACILLLLAVTDLGVQGVCALNHSDQIRLDTRHQQDLDHYRSQIRPKLGDGDALFFSAEHRITDDNIASILHVTRHHYQLPRPIGARLLRASYKAHHEAKTQRRLFLL